MYHFWCYGVASCKLVGDRSHYEVVLVTPPCRVQFVSWQDILLLRVPLCGYKCDFASLSPARHRKLSQQYTNSPQISVHLRPKKVIEFCSRLSQFVLVRVLWIKMWLTAIGSIFKKFWESLSLPNTYK